MKVNETKCYIMKENIFNYITNNVMIEIRAKDLVNEETKMSFDKWLLNHHLAVNQKGLLDFSYDKN